MFSWATLKAGFLVVVRLFLIFRKEPSAVDVRLKQEETTVNAVRNQNEMREDISNASDDSIDRELRQPWR